MESLRFEEEKMIKNITNLFRPNEELNYTTIKDKRKFFRLEKQTKEIKDRILTDIKNFF